MAFRHIVPYMMTAKYSKHMLETLQPESKGYRFELRVCFHVSFLWAR